MCFCGEGTSPHGEKRSTHCLVPPEIDTHFQDLLHDVPFRFGFEVHRPLMLFYGSLAELRGWALASPLFRWLLLQTTAVVAIERSA